jgi:MoxR-like ATPase
MGASGPSSAAGDGNDGGLGVLLAGAWEVSPLLADELDNLTVSLFTMNVLPLLLTARMQDPETGIVSMALAPPVVTALYDTFHRHRRRKGGMDDDGPPCDVADAWDDHHGELDQVVVPPRAAPVLAGAAKACAALDGRTYVTPEDVATCARACIAHRLVPL